MEDVNGRDFTIYGGFLVISHYMNFLTAVKGIYANSNSEVAFPAFKATKHGTVTLVLSGRNFWIDVTIHMDVKANPGPGTDRVNVTPWKPRSIRSQFKSSAAVVNYSRNQILSLRSKYQSSDELYHFLKDYKILRTRGIRAGISARQRYNQIGTSLVEVLLGVQYVAQYPVTSL